MSSRQKENKLRKQYDHVIAVDTAGIMAKAGPVISVCLEMDPNHQIYKVGASRKLALEEEYKFFKKIWKDITNLTISEVGNKETSSFGNRNAAKVCMERAIQHHLDTNDLDKDNCFFLLDFFDIDEDIELNRKAVKRGDEKDYIIACASIIANVLQKQYMKRIHSEFPIYNWEENYGYEDEKQKQALDRYGKSLFHR